MNTNLDRFKFPRTKKMPVGKVDLVRVDATTASQIRRHQRDDSLQAQADGAAYVRGIRERLGFSQSEFAARINIPLDTLRNWEQGKRKPTGAASALLKILDKAPKAALHALV
jgi:putative transcriptional regulator